jgi:hypothetical protein
MLRVKITTMKYVIILLGSALLTFCGPDKQREEVPGNGDAKDQTAPRTDTTSHQNDAGSIDSEG